MTQTLTKGSHILTLTLLKEVNIYGVEFVVSNLEVGTCGAATISSETTTIIQGESGLLDRTNWSVRADFVQADRDPTENWTTSGATEISETSGTSLCGLNSGCIIEIPFETTDSYNIAFQIVCAQYETVNCSTSYTVQIDNVTALEPDTGKHMGEGTASKYWNWKKYNAGHSDGLLPAGKHVITITLINNSSNLDSFRIITSK